MSVKDQPYPEIARERIKSTLLIEKLQEHILEGTEMKDSAVRAAIALLKKTVPDLAASTVTHQGPGGGPVVMSISNTDAEL